MRDRDQDRARLDAFASGAEPAVLLVPGWRNPKNGKLHIRRDCRAVEWYSRNMTPVLCRFDVEGETYRVLYEREHLCRYCFPTGLTIDAA